MPREYTPDWQRALIALSASVVITVIVAALYWARSICVPIALAIFLTFVLSPIVARLQRRGIGRTAAVILTVALAIVLVAASSTLIAQQVVKLSAEMTQPERANALKLKIVRLRNSLSDDESSRFGQLIDDVTALLVPKKSEGDPVPVVLVSTSPRWLAEIESYLSPASEILGQGAFAFILTVFMLLKREDLRNRVIRLTGHGKVTTTTKAVDDASRRISKYLLRQLLVNSTFGVVITVGLLLMGVKLAVLWGAIATAMRYVPYIGTWIGLIPPTLFSLAMSEGWGQPLAVFGLFIGLEAICNNFVEPRLYGQSMGLSEVAQLIAAGFWAFLWGPVGLILSGPLTVCLLVLGKYVSRFNYLEVLLGDEPVLPLHVAFYQRLTAHDQDEASDIALREATSADPATVFDSLLIPALRSARQDQNDGDVSAEDVRYIARSALEIGEEIVSTTNSLSNDAPDDAHRVRILLCPARDEIDHVGVRLLASLLDARRWEIEVTTPEILASELLARIAQFDPAAVVIGSLPPGGRSHTRYLVARVRNLFPSLKVIVGQWGNLEESPEGAAPRTLPATAGADWIESTLAETGKRLIGWYSVFVADEKADQKNGIAGGKNEWIGMKGASI